MTLSCDVMESTLNPRISPAVIDVVQSVNVVSCESVSVEMVGTADDVMVSASVGG